MIPLDVFGSESAAADLFQQLQRDIDVPTRPYIDAMNNWGRTFGVIVVDNDQEFIETVRVRTSLDLDDDGIS